MKVKVHYKPDDQTACHIENGFHRVQDKIMSTSAPEEVTCRRCKATAAWRDESKQPANDR